MNFVTKENINKGWSSDKKYCITDENGTKYLLRVSNISEYDKKLSEFNMMNQVSALGVPMCQPVEFGVCDEGVYYIQSWIDGSDARDIIPTLSDCEKYQYGYKSGRLQRIIHSIPAPETREDWDSIFNRKIDCKIKKYTECKIKYENGQAFIDYINENRYLLKDRPQSYQHGDYHAGNMIIGSDGKLYIIDFNRNDYGDPWEDIKSITWDVEADWMFAKGRINGYFDSDVPEEFWRIFALYISYGILGSIPWAIPFGEKQVQIMLNNAEKVLYWYDNMKNPIPIWYSKR